MSAIKRSTSCSVRSSATSAKAQSCALGMPPECGLKPSPPVPSPLILPWVAGIPRPYGRGLWRGSGKTTLTLHAIAEVQRRGGVAAFVDAEHALDPVYAASLGVDIENLLVSQPDTGEMALEIVDQLVRSAAVDIVVVDSVAALTPRAEIEGEMGDLAGAVRPA